jgi:dihydrofolate reductase
MRKVTLGLAVSLDHYIARQDGGSDWLHWNKEVAAISGKFMKTVDALLIGRKTYEAMLALGQTSYPGVRNYVFSRTRGNAARLKKRLGKATTAPVEMITTDAAEFIQDLKATPGKGIAVFGGGELAKSLFEADLIDEIVLNIHPIILGSGIPLFHEMKQQIDLTFLEAKPLKNGSLIVSYRVIH